MRIERERERRRIVRAGELSRALDQRAMADVDAVEVADRDRGAVAPARYVLVTAIDIHAGRIVDSAQERARQRLGTS